MRLDDYGTLPQFRSCSQAVFSVSGDGLLINDILRAPASALIRLQCTMKVRRACCAGTLWTPRSGVTVALRPIASWCNILRLGSTFMRDVSITRRSCDELTFGRYV